MRLLQKKNSGGDIIAEKQRELDSYIKESDETVSLVVSALDILIKVNEGIQEKVHEIEDYQAEFTNIREGLDSARARNEQVIKNLSDLLFK